MLTEAEEKELRSELDTLRRLVPDLTRRVTALERTVADLRSGRTGSGGGSAGGSTPAGGERSYILSNEDAARRDASRAKTPEHTRRAVSRIDQDFRAGESRDSVSGDGAPDRRP